MCFRAYIANVWMMNLQFIIFRAVALRLGLIWIPEAARAKNDVIGSLIFVVPFFYALVVIC